jgi:hypothetical protein
LSSRQFWSYTPPLHSRLFALGIVGGTAAFRKRFWDQGVRFPDASLAEDAAFLHALGRRGAGLARLAEDQEFYRRLKRITPGIVTEETSL